MNFAFYAGPSEARLNQVRRLTRQSWEQCRCIASADYCVSAQQRGHGVTLHCEDGVHLCLAGYVGADGLADKTAVLSALAASLTNGVWPLGDEWFGSFACVVFDTSNGHTVLANDALGYYPLYYCSLGSDELIAGSSQILLNRILGRPPDPVGLLQAISRPSFSNYGRRTLLHGVSRLLPGEAVSFSRDRARPLHLYDNSLYSELRSTDVEESAETAFRLLAKHVEFLCEGQEEVFLGLSGGWDSRVVLGALAHQRRGTQQQVRCTTYGQGDLYESRIARKCAQVSGGRFRSYPDDAYYFPAADLFSEYVRKTEAVYVTAWLAVLETAVPGGDHPLFLLGDMCESIDGRNILAFSTRAARVREFGRSLVGVQERFTPLDDAGFQAWEKRVVESIVARQMANFPRIDKALLDGAQGADIEQQLVEDVKTTTRRVGENEVFFVELLDELLAWYVRGRVELGRQMLILNARFTGVSPAMSFQILRAISNVHPRLRLRRRLMNAIARLDALKSLARIPSAQVPYLTMNAPSLLKELVWGGRSTIDQLLIRRKLGTRNHRARSRLLKSFDCICAYDNAARSGVVESWFSGRWFDPQPVIDTVRDRASLRAWPLPAHDIVGPANASKILDYAMDCQ
ncbi:MAG: hypothetical protein JXB62_06975 [Pirellulales bacterium]|nr:hypothetical protein [Pirellulales bacterium]